MTGVTASEAQPDVAGAGRASGPGGRDRAAAPVRARRRKPRAVANTIAVVFCLVWVFPIYWMVISALKGYTELGAFPHTWFPHWLDWGTFAQAVQAMPFFTFFRNTLVITVLVTVFSVFSNLVIAY
ncbi:hypothetical protein QT366_22890, partial [Xanthomonas citri pv. citri]